MTNRPLLPCPFCGCSDVGFIAEAKAFEPSYQGKVGHIICPKCFARAHGSMKTKEECIKAWNTRPPSGETKGVVWPALVGLEGSNQSHYYGNANPEEYLLREEANLKPINKLDILHIWYVFNGGDVPQYIDRVFDEICSKLGSPALVPLDEAELLKLSEEFEYPGEFICDTWQEGGIDIESFVRSICHKYGSPAKRVPSEEEIANEIQKFREWFGVEAMNPHYQLKRDTVLKLSKSICALLTQEEGNLGQSKRNRI